MASSATTHQQEILGHLEALKLEKGFTKTIELFKNPDYQELCRKYERSTEDEKEQLWSKFGEFEIDEHEKIILKEGKTPEQWRSLVNHNKQDSLFYHCTLAIIDLATKLDEQVDPFTAMNYMAERQAPTGAMEAVIFYFIEEYHPRGAEVKKEWRSYCKRVYG